MKIKWAMQNEQIDGVATNHSSDLLFEQKQMQTLDVEEMESFSKINNLKDVAWWMSIRNAYRLQVSLTAKFLKKRCISVATRGKPSCVARKHD